jgi:hypothetical protein
MNTGEILIEMGRTFGFGYVGGRARSQSPRHLMDTCGGILETLSALKMNVEQRTVVLLVSSRERSNLSGLELDRVAIQEREQ